MQIESDIKVEINQNIKNLKLEDEPSPTLEEIENILDLESENSNISKEGFFKCPVNLVIESVIKNPVPMAALDLLDEPLDTLKEFPIKKENLTLKEAWENKAGGDVFKNYNATFMERNNESTLEYRIQKLERLERELYYTHKKLVRFNKLKKAIRNLMHLHSVTLDELDNGKLQHKLSKKCYEIDHMKDDMIEEEERIEKQIAKVKKEIKKVEHVEIQILKEPPKKRRKLNSETC